jgi:hypothetical protein
MYQPKYSISDRLLLDLVKLEQDRAHLENVEHTVPVQKNLELKSKSVNMFHLAHMIGVDLTIKDAEKAVEGKKIATNDARGTIMNNFRNCMDFVRSNGTDSYIDLDVNMLLHFNKILLTEWKELWEAKFRTSNEELDSSLDNWAQLRDQDLKSFGINERLNEIFDWYKLNVGKVHPLIRIAIILYELMRAAPFAHLNEITIITVTDYLFQKNGYLTKTFLPIVREFDLHESENIELWNKVSENDGDLSQWLERFLQNLGSGIAEDRERIVELTMSDRSAKQPFLDLNRRQLKILRYLQTIPTVKREDYVQMMEVSTMTAFRDLSDLVEKKLIRIEGQGRGTKYVLVNR